jgi:hypothetical protein
VISSPCIGQAVQIWYGSKWRALCRHHGHCRNRMQRQAEKPRGAACDRRTSFHSCREPQKTTLRVSFVCLFSVNWVFCVYYMFYYVQ